MLKNKPSIGVCSVVDERSFNRLNWKVAGILHKENEQYFINQCDKLNNIGVLLWRNRVTNTYVYVNLGYFLTVLLETLAFFFCWPANFLHSFKTVTPYVSCRFFWYTLRYSKSILILYQRQLIKIKLILTNKNFYLKLTATFWHLEMLFSVFVSRWYP